MKNKMLLAAVAMIVMASIMIFTGCAKPPTEQVTALQNDMQNVETKGAKIFAPDQYAQISKKMNELQGMMDQKKFGPATALADSLKADITALITATTTNGKKVAGQAVLDVNAEIEKMKSFLAPETAKLLGAADSKSFADEITAFESQLQALKTDLDNSSFVKVYDDSNSLKGKIAASMQTAQQKIEAAKALEMEKAAKSKAKPKAKAAPRKK
ncbi:hypothetical protein LLG96_05510 [bacterium]|nr:hypothetical protein [bacterium]